MKIVRYQDGPATKWGTIEGGNVREMDGDPYGSFHLTSEVKRIQELP